MCEANKSNIKQMLRRFCAVLAIALTVAMLDYTVSSYSTSSRREGIKDIAYNELTKASIDSRLEISKSLFQVNLLFLAALWGLAIAKEGEAVILFSRDPETITFVCSSLLLIFSAVAHVLYLQTISAAYSYAAFAFKENNKTIMNLLDPRFNYLFSMQIYNLIAGSIIAILTILSAHKLTK